MITPGVSHEAGSGGERGSMTDVLVQPETRDLFAVTDDLKRRVKSEKIMEYNKLSADQKQAVNALIDDRVVKIVWKGGRPNIKYRVFAPMLEMLIGNFR